METLSLETCRLIVKHAGNRADICSLCRVSKVFRSAAERSLYNTLLMGKTVTTTLLCETLSMNSRLSSLVRALTIYLPEADTPSNSEEEDSITTFLPEGYWNGVAGALRRTTGLLHLNIHINDGSDTAVSWIFQDSTFLLQTFHCDLQWDRHLLSFLNRQLTLVDLYIIDYNETFSSTSITDSQQQDTSITPVLPAHVLDKSAMPDLSILESTFTEAAVALVPGRPVMHLKTSISHSQPESRAAEVSLLFQNLRFSKRRFRALDISDASYTESSSMNILAHVVGATHTIRELRYLGTLVLPIGGRERLHFYGSLMRIPKLQCIELEVTDWVPPPTQPGAFRALASELRLYCHTVNRVVFVQEFDRTVMSMIDGRWVLDNEVNTDILWREV